MPLPATTTLEDAIAFLESAANSNLIKIAGSSTAATEPMSAGLDNLDKFLGWGDLEQDAVLYTENFKGVFSIFADDPSSDNSDNEEVSMGN